MDCSRNNPIIIKNKEKNTMKKVLIPIVLFSMSFLAATEVTFSVNSSTVQGIVD